MAIDLVGYVPLSGANVSSTGAKTVTMTAIGSGAGTGDRYAAGGGLAPVRRGGYRPRCERADLHVNYLDVARQLRDHDLVHLDGLARRRAVAQHRSGGEQVQPVPAARGGRYGRESDIESLTWAGTAHASGTVIIGLCKPLWTIPVPATGLYNKVDFVNALPSMRQIKDGANIQFLLFQTGATSSAGTINVDFDYGYGG